MYMTQLGRGTRNAIQRSTEPDVNICKVQGNYEGKKTGGDREKSKKEKTGWTFSTEANCRQVFSCLGHPPKLFYFSCLAHLVYFYHIVT